MTLEYLEMPENKKELKKTLQEPTKCNDGSMSKGPGSQPKELPIAKAGKKLSKTK